jgi:hypothetical protein
MVKIGIAAGLGILGLAAYLLTRNKGSDIVSSDNVMPQMASIEKIILPTFDDLQNQINSLINKKSSIDDSISRGSQTRTIFRSGSEIVKTIGNPEQLARQSNESSHLANEINQLINQRDSL